MKRFGTWDIVGVSAICGIVAVFQYLFERREYRRNAAFVRAGLDSERCSCCYGNLGAWDGRIEPGDAHFNPGGYLPRISVSCDRCHAQQVFYLSWDGSLFRDPFRESPDSDGHDDWTLRE